MLFQLKKKKYQMNFNQMNMNIWDKIDYQLYKVSKKNLKALKMD